MHQNAALGELFAAPIDLADASLSNEPNALGLIALIGKRRCVLKDKYRAFRISEALARCLEVSAQYVLLTDMVVGKKSIGGLRIRPVLAGKWNALAHVLPELLKQQTEAPLESLVSKTTGGIFLIHPGLFAFRRQQMTRPEIVWRSPRRHLIAIKFLM